jgi:hypothetical protein
VGTGAWSAETWQLRLLPPPCPITTFSHPIVHSPARPLESWSGGETAAIQAASW